MIEKDKSILSLVENLKNKLDFRIITLVDYWDGDLCAIGIKKANKLVYISTCNYLNCKPILYDFEIEELSKSTEAGYEVVKRGISVSETELIKAIKFYFEL